MVEIRHRLIQLVPTSTNKFARLSSDRQAGPGRAGGPGKFGPSQEPKFKEWSVHSTPTERTSSRYTTYEITQ